MKYLIFTFFTLLIFLQCCNLSFLKKGDCSFEKIETIFSEISIHHGLDTGYAHYVLVQKYLKNCRIDSIEFLNMSRNYMDTVSYDYKPIKEINFFSSVKRFIPYEVSQIWTEVNKDCLVSIWLDSETQKPVRFIFYDENGDIEMDGPTWKR